ncbi:MAG: DUF3800 domain-containing protein [Pirellulales bacterium]|nr:DUF3800 domain-containing protein [Pirellulales bacterium]
MGDASNTPPPTCHYFVDEAGDPVLFNRHKQIVVGKEGCSRYFMLGLLEVAEPDALAQKLETLRAELLADPYLSQVESMKPARRKTAYVFHAKDDCPEVRREVYRCLVESDVRFFAVVRDKLRIATLVREHNLKKPSYRYHPNQLYDRCVSRLFKQRLHKEGGYRIWFSERGSKPRTEALDAALTHARRNFRFKSPDSAQPPIEIAPSSPRRTICLQAVDYFLWALQRLYERGEDRFWEYVTSKVSLVHDVDDTRTKEYGAYYTRDNPLTAEKRKKEPGI